MTVKELAEKLELEVFTAGEGLEREVKGAYIGDLLSWVMSHASKGNLWVTVLNHINIVAVAVMTEVSCILLPEGIKPENQTIERAKVEGITVLGSKHDAYTIACLLNENI